MQGVFTEMQSVLIQVIPYDKTNAADYDQKHDRDQDNGVIVPACQGRKRFITAHQIKSGIAKCRNGVENTIVNTL